MFNINTSSDNSFLGAGVDGTSPDLFKYIPDIIVVDTEPASAITDTTTVIGEHQIYIARRTVGGAYQYQLRAPIEFNGSANSYVLSTLNMNTMKFPVATEPGTFAIDPDNLGNMTVSENNDVSQYVRFNISNNPPSDNIYSGINTLFGYTGSNANLTTASPGTAACSTTILSIKFLPGTFEPLSADTVKQYLREHQLIFYYKTK